MDTLKYICRCGDSWSISFASVLLQTKSMTYNLHSYSHTYSDAALVRSKFGKMVIMPQMISKKQLKLVKLIQLPDFKRRDYISERTILFFYCIEVM